LNFMDFHLMSLHLSVTALLVVWLAVWCVSRLLWGEDGPADIFVRLRRLAGDGFYGRLLDCFCCLILWIALPFGWVLATSWFERPVFWFSFSGGAILPERARSRHSSQKNDTASLQ
jgi:hypothetical protein